MDEASMPWEMCARSDVSPLETRLSARIIDMARRLAALLDHTEWPEIQRSVAFLRVGTGLELGPPSLQERAGARVLERFTAAWGLDDVDLDLLTLAALPEEHEGYASVLQTLHARSEPRPSVGLAAQLLAPSPSERAALRHRLEHGVLTRVGLLHVVGDDPLFNRTLLLGPGVSTLLRGGFGFESRDHRASARTGLEFWLDLPGPRRAVTALRQRAAVDLLLGAEDLRVACDRARALAAEAGRDAFEVEFEAESSWPALTRATTIRAIGRDQVPIVVVHPTDPPRPMPQLPELASAAIFCVTRTHLQLTGRRSSVSLMCDRLDPEGLRTAWAELLPEFADHAAALAARFPLEPALIHDVARDVRVHAALAHRSLESRDLHELIRLRAGGTMRPGMRLQRPAATWSSLVLPGDRLELLQEALGRVRHQACVLDEWGFLEGRPGGRGVRMLFCGPPGTGKTLSAEVLAHELGTDLILVDLSRLVSKWIGETEKNLAEVFAAAERSRAVLFFDEADALFGKRTEISDAHDRYANLETAYLLTRLEHYEGLAILATNLRRNIDAAFMRRLEFVVEYELPARAERLQLWRVHVPPHAPMAPDIDLGELADFYPLPGGLIRNAAVAAAFLAAQAGQPICRAHLLRAIRREYEKTGAAFPGTPPPRSRR